MNAAVLQFEEAVAATPPETWYDQARGQYLIRDSRGDWLPLNETQYKRVLKQHGLSGRVDSGQTVSAVDAAILQVQQERNIHFAGPLAGYTCGVYEFGATRALVTSSPRIIEPVKGEWPMIEKLLKGLLGEHGEQIPYFLGWLKVAYEALRAGVIRPGQAVALCGPHNCGKSLLQNLVTEVLGGRAAKPYQSMTASTAFNSDLFGAEHLMVEDEQPSTDIRARRAFGAQIKNVTVAEVQRLHAKHRDALVLRPFWRLTVSLNDEEENLLVLPPLDDSIADKIMLFRARRAPMPMPTGTINERQAFWGTLIGELPAFLDHLMTWEIPVKLRCSRFGVKHYHHPEIVAVLDALAPEARLLSLIDQVFFTPCIATGIVVKGKTSLEDTAEGIERDLLGPGSPCAYEARRLLSWNNACGAYLGRLAKSRPDRVQAARTATDRRWRITQPATTDGDSSDTMTPTFGNATTTTG